MVSMTKKLFAKWKIIFIALINFSNHEHFSPVSYWEKRAIKLAGSTLKHTNGAICSLQCCSLNAYSCFKDRDYHKYIIKVQKKPSSCVLRKGCSENKQQIYKRTPTPKCDFNLLCNFIEIALRHAQSPVNLLHFFRTPYCNNT